MKLVYLDRVERSSMITNECAVEQVIIVRGHQEKDRHIVGNIIVQLVTVPAISEGYKLKDTGPTFRRS